ncbi:MAG: sigma-70 family RNA polymerase sigma factor [Actinomycetota bacterium]|nr:sigma-70 family RNA polymerase sigma factor [Actinomycetota bacterium]
MVTGGTTTDEALVERVRAGQRQAFAELVGRYDERLRGLAWSMLGDVGRMDDALQDAYLKAYVGLAHFDGRSAIGTWLYRIVANACIDELRRGRRRPTPVDATDHEHDRPVERTGPDGLAADADLATRVLHALPGDQRATVVLVDGHGFDTRTAAEILGVAHGTVRSRLSRARAHARRIIEEEQA